MRARALLPLVVMLRWLGFADPVAAETVVSFGFDEANGTTALNGGTLGAAANGTLNSGATRVADTPSGSGTALWLDGIDDFVRVTTTFAYGSAFTVEAWIRPEQVDGQRVIWDDYGNPGVLLAVSSGSLQFGVSTTEDPGPGLAAFSPQLVCTDEWIHVAGVYDGAELRAYVNGAVAASTATSGAVIDNPNSASAIGSDNEVTNALNFAGGIDDLRVHTSALAPAALGGGLAGEGYDCVPEPSLGALSAAVLAALAACRRRAAPPGARHEA